MYACNVSMHLRANTAREFARALQQDVLPMLRKQSGFTDGISFVAADCRDAMAISLWERQEDADAYNRDVYPKVLRSLAKVVEGTPRIEAYEVSNSTFHEIGSKN